MASRRYLVTTYAENWSDEMRGTGRYCRNIYADPGAAQEEAARRKRQGVRGVVIVPFDQAA
jgi:hypothetical protein